MLKVQPKNAQLYSDEALPCSKHLNPSKAVADFNKALELDPEMEEIYWYRADAYRALNDLEQALKDYRRAAATIRKIRYSS